MNLFSVFEQRIRAAVESVIGAAGLEAAGEALNRIAAEPPRDPSHGDVATNAAMVLAKPLQAKPRELAIRIAAKLEADPDVASVEVAGPGFVNLRLSDAFWAGQLAAILPRRHELRPLRRRRRRQGECRIRLRQPDRADACRPLPRRGRRRRGRQSACGDRPCRDARILHQRCRRAGRGARPLRLPAISRGARRRHRHDPERALSRRLSEAGRRGAEGRVRKRAPGAADARMAAGRARADGRRDDGR